MSTLRFRASLAERSAVSRHQDGCTIRLEVAETDLEAAIGVLALNKCVLWVSIEPEARADDPPPVRALPKTTKRTSQRTHAAKHQETAHGYSG